MCPGVVVSGVRPSDAYFRTANQLGESIAAGGFTSLADIDPGEILMRY